MGVTRSRAIAVSVIIGLFCAVLVGVTFWAQIINQSTAGNVGAYTVSVEAVRGEILDRNGTPLITNRQGNSVTFNAAAFPDASHQPDRNAEILSLVQLAKANKIDYIDNLPIGLGEDGHYFFWQDEVIEKEVDGKVIKETKHDNSEYLAWLKSVDMLNLNDYATADNCMDALVERYQLQSYSKQDARDIASVCVQMKKENFGTAYPYTFAEDVPTNFVTIIMENKAFYKGVENTMVAYREYTNGSVAPHILGRVSSIDAETYAKKQSQLEEALAATKSSEEAARLKRNAYTIRDVFGSSGIEQAMEEYLRGSRGVKTVTLNADGTSSESYTVEPKQGDTVVLTIDTNLQKVAQDTLRKRVNTLNISSRRQCAAAVVVEDVTNGDILACATYPTYDNSTWKENYSTWAKDTNSPLWNRALNSLYEPGSTFKPLVAIAALEEGTINPEFSIYCNGSYTHYSDHTYHCAHNTAHGTVDVVEALNQSCNCFFYETGRLLGITKLDQWADAFGLGQKTGLEVAEAAGQMSSPEERKANGGIWYAGDTITAAIGQCDNQFTLVQMSNYVTTIANGGTRFVPHLVKRVLSADYKTTVLDRGTEIAQKINISDNTLRLVKEGMLRVGTIGFCKEAFADLPIKVAAKTGTSEVTKKIGDDYVEGNNGFLISFAPYEKPEIAVTVVVETADAGALTAVVAADIYDYYFSENNLEGTYEYNTLLK